jgi:heterodisulfide reductase subunit D
MEGGFHIHENLYTAMHKCTRCGQCAYGTEEAEFHLLCPLQINGLFFTYSAGGLMQLARALYEGKIRFTDSVRDILFQCTTCGVCEENCGVIADQVDLITLLKKELVRNNIPLLEPHRALTENVVNRKSPYSGRLPRRTGWMPKEMEKKLSPKPEVFYFVGCVSSYMETEIAHAWVSILDKLDIPFTVDEEEWCCGAPLYFAGLEDKVHDMVIHNVDAIEKSGASTAVMTCPTCSMIFKKYYPRWMRKDLNFEVLHVAEYLERLQKQGRLHLGSLEKARTVTYHDPCHLGRGQGIYDAPRKILDSMEGVTLKEMNLSGENSLCCGGGGLLPTGFPVLSDALARERASAMKACGAEWIVSSCPGCKENLKIAAKKVKRGARAVDLTELVDRALG